MKRGSQPIVRFSPCVRGLDGPKNNPAIRRRRGKKGKREMEEKSNWKSPFLPDNLRWHNQKCRVGCGELTFFINSTYKAHEFGYGLHFQTCRAFLRVLFTFIRIPKWELSPGHRLGKSLNSGNNKVFKPGKPMNDMTVIRNWARNVPKKQRIVVNKNLFIVLGI